MTDEEIRKAAREAFDAKARWIGLNTGMFVERHLQCLDDVYRAGMEAGRAEAAAKPKRRKAADSECATVSLEEMVAGGVHRHAAEDWLRVRKQHKAPLTRSAWDATIREALAANMTIGAVVQMCAERSWRGFRAEYVAKDAPSGPGRGPRSAESFQSQAALARVQRIAPGAARKDAGSGLKSWQEAIEGTIDAGQPRLR